MLIKREWKGKSGMKQAERVKECQIYIVLYNIVSKQFYRKS